MAAMCDWLNFVLPFTQGLAEFGRISKTSRGGVIEWEAPGSEQVPGSHEKTIRVGIDGLTGNIYVSGNPAKFFQGHNIFGSGDVPALSVQMAIEVSRHIGVELPLKTLRSLYAGEFTIKGIHATRSYRFASQADAEAAHKHLTKFATMDYRGRGTPYGGSTHVFGEKSKRSRHKFYLKHTELASRKKGHTLPAEIPFYDELMQHARGLYRHEVELYSTELKERKLDYWANWVTLGVTLDSILDDSMAALNISDNIVGVDNAESLRVLPATLRLVYDAWTRGTDLRAMYPKRTFYRHRRALLDALNIDIATVVEPDTGKARQIPLRVILTGMSDDVPQWALGTPVYFDPDPVLLIAA